jgi:hypothetical protein
MISNIVGGKEDNQSPFFEALFLSGHRWLSVKGIMPVLLATSSSL